MGHHSCCNKQKVRRGLWSPEEDEKLINYISTYGHGCWSSVPRLAGLQRCGKSCRLRWINYLRPDLKRGNFSTQEAFLIIELHRILGNRWSQIAKHLPGRTDNEVKNFWNSSIKKKHISLHDVSNHVGSDQDLLPMNANPNLILDAQQDHFQLPNSTSMLQIYDHGDLKPDSMDYTVNSVEMPPPPPPLSSDGSLSYPEWSWDYQPHYHDDHHQSHPLEDDQSVEMYGNGEIMCQTQVDAKFPLTSYDDEPLVGSTMPKLCETFDMDECGMSSSASHEVDPSTGLPCFPSQAYPYYPHVPTSIMPSSSSFEHFDMNPSRPSSSNWYP